MAVSARPWSSQWLFGAVVAGAVFVVIWVFALFGPPFDQRVLVQGAAEVGLAVSLVVAAVAFVFEVIRRVTSA